MKQEDKSAFSSVCKPLTRCLEKRALKQDLLDI